MTEPAITADLVRQHGLTTDEYARVLGILGREPTFTELGIFSVMWSEHCSYKHTRPLLKTLPTKSPRVLVGAGDENAGIIDIGDGLAIAFKIESHNHPSAVEPFQGAATGVGGIIRDIFTMGARPIGAMNSLRFGPICEPAPSQPGPPLTRAEEGQPLCTEGSGASNPKAQRGVLAPPGEEGRGEREPAPTKSALSEFAERQSPIADSQSPMANRQSSVANNRRLFAGAVGGIAHYGNCFGIPTVAGEVDFDPCYEGNPLVNAFCIGLMRHDQIVRGTARGVGNPVFYVGPATGRDGLAGAAFASQDLTKESAELQRGAVQVGDPFMEKLVCEACLELLATGAVAGIQDMGAAGLTCSTCETAARAGTGIDIELSRVPQRAPGMTPYEILLSESQERMLLIIHRGQEGTVQRIFEKWDLPWAEIGQVTDTGRLIVRHHGQVVADIPAAKLANEAPVYRPAAAPPAYLQAARAWRLEELADCQSPVADLRRLLAAPSLASKNWVYRQYDQMVRDGTVVCPGSDAAVLRLKPDALPPTPANCALGGLALPGGFPEKLIALTVDGNAAYVYLDPYVGGKIAVAEAARNLACAGATPLGVTDNLNFGNPHHPEIFWQLQEAVRGLAEGCRAFNAPVTGGNVSLYNQNPAGPIDPTPTVAMVGRIDRLEHITTQWFKEEGDVILLLGELVAPDDPWLGLGGSVYLRVLRGVKAGAPPPCDLEREKELHLALRALIHSGVVRSAHDCSDGGLAVALAECCLSCQVARGTPRLIGARVDLTPFAPHRLDGLLFGESQGRIVISVAAVDAVKVLEQARILGVPATRLGTVGGRTLELRTERDRLSWDLPELHDLWWNALARLMQS